MNPLAIDHDPQVRREKALVHSGWKSRPGAGSFRPVTIEAAVEVTKPLKPSVKRVAWRLGEHAGRNASERWAGLETGDAGADPPCGRGRPTPMEQNERTGSSVLPG